MKIDSKEIRQYIREAQGRGNLYADLISASREYTNIKKAMKLLVARKVDEEIHGKKLIEETDAFLSGMDRIRVGALVSRIAKIEIMYSRMGNQATIRQKEIISKAVKEIGNYIYMTVSTLDNFLGGCFDVMAKANSPKSDYAIISAALSRASKGLQPCIYIVGRKQLNELFAEIEKIFAEIEAETAEEVTENEEPTSAEAPESTENEDVTVTSTEEEKRGGEAHRPAVKVTIDDIIEYVYPKEDNEKQDEDAGRDNLAAAV